MSDFEIDFGEEPTEKPLNSKTPNQLEKLDKNKNNNECSSEFSKRKIPKKVDKLFSEEKLIQR